MTRGLVLLLCGLAGCTPGGVPNPAPPPAPAELGGRFDPTATGTVRGQVTWRGPVPAQERAAAAVPRGDKHVSKDVGNPFRPAVDPATGGLAGVLVSLDGIDPARSRPWDHPPVTVTMTDFEFRPSSTVVRAGDAVTFVSEDSELHVVRGRSAAFFSLTLPAPNQPRARRLDTPGVVELTSGAGYYWAAVELCVGTHPYHAVTDAQGRYELPQVPDGSYTLTMRFRDPTVTAVERDPETGLPFRHVFAPPVVRSFPVAVTRGQVTTRDFVADVSLFQGPR